MSIYLQQIANKFTTKFFVKAPLSGGFYKKSGFYVSAKRCMQDKALYAGQNTIRFKIFWELFS